MSAFGAKANIGQHDVREQQPLRFIRSLSGIISWCYCTPSLARENRIKRSLDLLATAKFDLDQIPLRKLLLSF
jgi:hypothetical protein